jgi:hypothetical protein
LNRGLGTLNRVSITVSKLDEAMRFFEPWLDFVGGKRAEYRDRSAFSGRLPNGVFICALEDVRRGAFAAVRHRPAA